MKVCFTGHRPNKLGGYDWNTEKNVMIMDVLEEVIKNIIERNNAKTFYFGGALGIDQMSFEIVKKLQEDIYPNIKLILAIPFEDQPIKWFNNNDVKRYNTQKLWADKVVFVDTEEGYKFDKVEIGEYHLAKLQIRNTYMVDHSELVVAVWDGTKGGTENCVKYAKKIGKAIIIIDPNNVEGWLKIV